MARIMVVDDAAFMRQVYRKMLIGSAHTICAEAANGYEAIAMYQESHPDLVLLDITMPGMSGVDALKAIMELDANATVIMASAMGQEAFIGMCVEAGAKDFLVKPVVKEILLGKINEILKV